MTPPSDERFRRFGEIAARIMLRIAEDDARKAEEEAELEKAA